MLTRLSFIMGAQSPATKWRADRNVSALHALHCCHINYLVTCGGMLVGAGDLNNFTPNMVTEKILEGEKRGSLDNSRERSKNARVQIYLCLQVVTPTLIKFHVGAAYCQTGRLE